MTTKDKYKKVAYYPGCALEGSGHSYNRSTKAVGKALGLDLVEVKNWNCCGAMEVKNVDPKLQTYLSSRVMSVAANEMDMDVVMAPCNGCYHNLKKAEYDLANDDESVEVVDRLSKKAGHKTYESGQVETIHLRLHVHAAATYLPRERPGTRQRVDLEAALHGRFARRSGR
jgi:heterodisulfide reductase subunit B